MTLRTDVQTYTLDRIADALEYPHPRSARAATQAASRLAEIEPAAGAAFAALAAWLQRTPPWEQEEVYTRLFDLGPVCTLHVGYHVFGEAYQRGALLAGLVGELRRAGVEPQGQLPDYLPTMLRLWGRLARDDSALLLHDRILAPGIARMAQELTRVDTPWARAVAALAGLFPVSAAETEAELGRGRPTQEVQHA
jgi:nitrate reductase molybdenum cofactor assembly chaperone